MHAKPQVVVTGASTGIGWGITHVLTSKGIHVYGTVRHAKDADRLRTQFGSAVTPLLLDVTDESAVRDAAGRVDRELNGRTLAGVVNNAGIAVPGPLLYATAEDIAGNWK